ncbi:MAG: hypothetical protein ACFCUS_03905 [Rubrimonas sp.]|uniref:hypothetical protein n=1 Tax=Rubrimonas sp. TaxID=2036015 RepID=UPI002FDC9175
MRIDAPLFAAALSRRPDPQRPRAGAADEFAQHGQARARGATATRVTLWPDPRAPRCDILRATPAEFVAPPEGVAPDDALNAARRLGPDFAAQEGAARAALGCGAPEDMAMAVAREALAAQAARLMALPALLGDAPAAPPEPGADAADISRALFGEGGAPRCAAEFERWIGRGQTPLASAFAMLWTRCDARWGRADLALWSPASGLAGLDWRRAEWFGAPVEAGVAARVCDCDLARSVEARRGRGLVWRFVARLTDAARLIAALRDGAGAPPLAPAHGVGVALTARGPLLLRARLRPDGRVAALERLDAAAFALHPGGALAQALAHLPHGDAARQEMAARLIVDSLDLGRVRVEVVAQGEARGALQGAA